MIGLDQYNPTEAASLHNLANGRHVRQESSPLGLHHEHSAATRFGDESAALISVHRERLFHQHGLIVLERQHRVVEVHGVRRGDVDDVDVGISDQRLVRAVSVFNAVSIGEHVHRYDRS